VGPPGLEPKLLFLSGQTDTKRPGSKFYLARASRRVAHSRLD